MNRNFFNKSIKIIGVVLIMAFSFQGCKVNIFDPLSPDGASIMDSAESLTEKGDAFFANGDLSSAETAYKAALKKDPNYGPALIGLAAVELQKAVSPDGTKTFTANVLPQVYKGLLAITTATDTGDGEFTQKDFQTNESAQSIAQKKQVAQAAKTAYNTLIKLSNPDLTEMINLSVLLGFNIIFKLDVILNSLENFQTIVNQFEKVNTAENQFILDYNEIISFDPTTLSYDVTLLNTQLDNFRDLYQKLYYVYYLFTEVYDEVKPEVDDVYLMLEDYFRVVGTSENQYVQKIFTEAQTIKQNINNVYEELKEGDDYIGYVKEAAGKIIDIENQVQDLKLGVNADISLCGKTIDGVTGEVGVSQFTDNTASPEYKQQPVISDDVDKPCTGDNWRFEPKD